MYKLLIITGFITLGASLFLFFSSSLYRGETLGSIIWKVSQSEQLALLAEPKNPNLTFSIAEYYFNQGSYNLEKAEKYYTETIKLDPQYKESYYQRGRIFFIQGKFLSALLDINTVLRIDPEFTKAYYMYGLVNGYADNFAQAEYGFQEFIKRDSFNWAGYNDLAWVYFKQGDYTKTEEMAKKGLEQAPNNPWLLNIYGTALLNRGGKKEARAILERALAESEHLAPQDWGRAYPGNHPALYANGLEETRSVIKHNLNLVAEAP